jgi:hypothetical protein
MTLQYTIVALIVGGAAWIVVRKLVAPFLKSAAGSCGCGSESACGATKRPTPGKATAGSELPRAPFGSEEWLAEIARLEAARDIDRDPHTAH